MVNGPLPDCIAEQVGAAERRVIDLGQPHLHIEAIGPAGAPVYYLKMSGGDFRDDIVAEAARLGWAGHLLPLPKLLAFAEDAKAAWLLTTVPPGRNAWDALHRPNADTADIAARIGRFLRSLHALPIGDCPFDMRPAERLIAARRNIALGRLAGAETADWPPAARWDDMMTDLPDRWQTVITHGDFSLENIRLDERGNVVGLLNGGRLGLADPYQDLALLWDTLGDFGVTAQQAAFAAYGLAEIDPRRLNFHLLLDTFF